jgi:hypothetical protein
MSDFGITKLSDTLLESVDVELKAETKELITSTGTHSEARSIDQSYSFSVKGKGTTTVTLGGSTGAPTGVSGKVIVTNVTKSQSNEDWAGFSYSGVAYVHAT